MVEKSLIIILTVVFLFSSWWWSNRQQAAVDFYEEQLRERDATIVQLRKLALPGIYGKSVPEATTLLQTLYPKYEVLREENRLVSGFIGVTLTDGATVTSFYFPWDDLKQQ